MLRKISNVFTKKDVKNIKKAFQKIKNKEKYLRYVKEKEIITEDILDEPKIRKIHDKIIYPKAQCFFNEKDRLYTGLENTSHFQIEKSILKWSYSENYFSYCDKNLIQGVICNQDTKFEFYILNKLEDILKPNDILLVDNNTPIKFYNHNISDLIFFYYTEELKEEIVENYAE